MSIISRIVQAGSKWIGEGLAIGSVVRIKRTHHQFIHPTKGYRMFARPGKANSRRKLIRTGALMMPESKTGGRVLREILGGRWSLSKCRAYYSAVFARG